MTKIQILENESFIQYADFENCEVWLLNRTNEEELDERIVNIAEITESLESSATKFPMLLTEIYKKYPTYEEVKNNVIVKAEATFDYEILSDTIENYSIHSYVCDTGKIKIC